MNVSIRIESSIRRSTFVIYEIVTNITGRQTGMFFLCDFRFAAAALRRR
jgi:hypothetical protein